MSKSKRNVVDPSWIADKFGPDYLRYFLLREIPFGEDGNFSPALFVKRVNSDLANDLGNLLNRTLALVVKYCGKEIPPPHGKNSEDRELQEKVKEMFPRVEEHMSELSFSDALSSIWETIREANLYIDRCAPWRLVKEGKKERMNTVLYNVLEVVRILSILLFPFIPEGTKKMWGQLGIPDDLETKKLKDAASWGKLAAGLEIRKEAPVFPRIKEEEFYESEKQN